MRAPRLIPIIAGPTAGGKSALALELAMRLRESGVAAELISADAYQVYRGLDIGTAKPSLAERMGVAHHLVDVAAPRERFTVSDWLRATEVAIADVQSRDGVPIVVGGTHLYLKNLLDGMFEGPGADDALRTRLAGMETAELRAELGRIDPAAADRIHANDTRRTIRAIEVFRLTGIPISAHQRQWTSGAGAVGSRFTLITLAWRPEALNPRINARVKTMMERGLLEETRALAVAGAFEGPHNQAKEALGYKQLLSHLAGRDKLDDAIERIKIETRQFAKSQRTWLRRLRTHSGTIVIDADAIIENARAEWVAERW